MDRKKKIIVALASLAFMLALVGFLKVMLFPSKAPQGEEGIVTITTPKVDEDRIRRESKIEEYGKTAPAIGTMPQGTGDFFEGSGTEEDLGPDNGAKGYRNEGRSLGQGPTALPGTSLGYSMDDPSGGEEAVDLQLRELMELQQQLMDQYNPAPDPGYSVEDMEALLKSYGSDTSANGSRTVPAVAVPGGGGAKKGSLTETKGKDGAKMEETEGPHFHGAGSINASDSRFQLTPAETIDAGIVKNGSLVAIRLKRGVQLMDPYLWIPHGAVLYGKVNFSSDRLMIEVQSYRRNDLLYRIDLSMYDFDGREGIHLGNRTWSKIPSKVAKDVYEYAYQKGTQATSAFGGDNTIDLDEAQDIAVLSASNHLGEELFEKRRVFIPRKYHLWLTVNNK